MSQKSNFARRCQVACVGLLLPLALVGCGGSSSSSNAVSTPAANVPAVIAQNNSGTVSSDYTLTLLPSGSATYNRYTLLSPTTPGITPGPIQTGTVSAALTAQFFKDLTAAMPLQNLPPFTGPSSVISTSVSVQYQGQSGHIDNPGDAHEQALAADVTAIAQSLGLPTS